MDSDIPKNVSKKHHLVLDLQEAQDKSDRLAVYVLVFVAVFHEINGSHNLLVSQINKQQDLLTNSIDLQFSKLISREVSDSEFDQYI